MQIVDCESCHVLLCSQVRSSQSKVVYVKLLVYLVLHYMLSNYCHQNMLILLSKSINYHPTRLQRLLVKQLLISLFYNATTSSSNAHVGQTLSMQ